MAAMVILIALLGACELGTDSGGSKSGIDYTSYNGNYSILVRNNTSQNLVAFKGSLDAENIIGGIPAHATNHALKNNPALFDRTQDFPMIILTEEQYKANKNNLKSQENTPFTRVYVFFNKNGENTNIYEISDRLGGVFRLTIQNPSVFNVELRLGGINGETIGYAPSGMLTTTLYVNDGDFNIFPVFKRYNSFRDTVETLIPYGASGFPWFKPLGFEDIPGGRDQTFNIKDAIDTLAAQTSGVAWLAINNQSTGAVHLMKGTSIVRTSTGVSYFSGLKTFQIDMPTVQVGSQYKYGDSISIASYVIGPDAFEVPIIDKATGVQLAEELKGDYMYTVTVTGDHNNLTLKAEINMEEGSSGGPVLVLFTDW